MRLRATVNGLLVLLFTMVLSPFSWAFETKEDSFWHDLIYRSYEYYVPPNLSGPVPLIIDLHGHSSSSESQKNRNEAQLKEIADREGLVLAWPRATSQILPTAWNGGPCCLPATNLNIDDVGYIEKIVSRVSSRVSIDQTRVYAFGKSNGAIMAQRLGLQSSDVFAAIAPVSFQLIDNPTWRIPGSWYPDRAVPQLELHGIDDDVVSYYSGITEVVLGDYIIWLNGAQEGRDKWAKINACRDEFQRTSVETSMSAYRDSYSSCKQNVKVELITAMQGGHGIDKSETRSDGVNVQEEQWAFASQFQKPGHQSDRIWEGQKLKKNQWLVSPNGKFRMIFKKNGNLIVKNMVKSKLLWESGSGDKSGDRLEMQKDGNLVIYRDGYWGWKGFLWVYFPEKAIWASNTVGTGESRLQISDNGQLTVFRNNISVWQKN